MEKLKIKEAILVEGRYDKNALSQVVDAPIIETSGFGIFSDAEKMKLLLRIAQKRGIIIFTDSDGAGFLIRNHIKGCIPASMLKQAYAPEIYGKEKRKKTASKEGKLGVEGMKPQVLREALIRAGATVEGEESRNNGRGINKADMYAAGLSGREGSAEKREKLAEKLGFPKKLSADALMQVLNTLYEKDEALRIISE